MRTCRVLLSCGSPLAIFLVGVNLPAQEKVRRKRIDDDGQLFYSVKNGLYKYDRRVRLAIKSPGVMQLHLLYYVNIIFVILY